MSRVTELEKALTTLFRKGTEVGYTETEIDEFLENIYYHALLQAVWNKAETVYAYGAVSGHRHGVPGNVRTPCQTGRASFPGARHPYHHAAASQGL